MIYGYIRVSTVKQASEGNSLEGQKKLLLENGVKEENIYKIFIRVLNQIDLRLMS